MTEGRHAGVTNRDALGSAMASCPVPLLGLPVAPSLFPHLSQMHSLQSQGEGEARAEAAPWRLADMTPPEPQSVSTHWGPERLRRGLCRPLSSAAPCRGWAGLDRPLQVYRYHFIKYSIKS